MARKQATTLTEIAEAALVHISAHGFKQSQMSDIAKQIGISAGTLYLYVENKEALLGLASTYLLDRAMLETAPLPLKAVPREKLVVLFTTTAQDRQKWPALKQAIAMKASDAESFKAVGYDLYDLISDNRRAIWFFDRLAFELPEFAAIQLNAMRGRTLKLLTELLAANGQSSIAPDALAIIARSALEILAWSAMHRHADGLGAQPTDSLSEETIRDLAVLAFNGALQAAFKEKPAT